MKISKIIIVIILLFVLLIPIKNQVIAQQGKNELIVSQVLENFETNDKNWQAVGSKFTKKGFPQVKPLINDWPTALFGKKGDPNNKYCLGVRTSYYKMGYNFLKIFPENGIKVPGIAKAFYIWVWGANFSYDMEMQITDYKGITHTLPVGRLNYLGWKVHRIDVPDYIPQTQQTVPRIKRLKFERFTIWSLPGAPLENFYVYFDHFTVLTDITNETFDGDDLANHPDEYWQSENKNGQ